MIRNSKNISLRNYVLSYVPLLYIWLAKHTEFGIEWHNNNIEKVNLVFPSCTYWQRFEIVLQFLCQFYQGLRFLTLYDRMYSEGKQEKLAIRVNESDKKVLFQNLDILNVSILNHVVYTKVYPWSWKLVFSYSVEIWMIVHRASTLWSTRHQKVMTRTKTNMKKTGPFLKRNNRYS